MPFRIEHECPQCGGPLEMAETDRLLRCSFCNVQSFLCNNDPLHFILPRRQPDPYTIYAPYLRFKGTVYKCLDSRIADRLVDITTKGVDLPFLPTSLGLRPQAVKMRFVSPEVTGSYLKRSVRSTVILKRAAENSLNSRDAVILHQAFVGDAINIIYLPLSIMDEKILDGVAEDILADIPAGTTPFAAVEIKKRTWHPNFLSALCPQCGWNLEGGPESVVLLCSNCNSGWQAGGDSFARVRFRITPTTDKSATFIPFWHYKIAAAGLRLDSFADFIRITNQALVIKPEWEDMKLHFVSPAFKIRPHDFLRLSTQMTIGQRVLLPATASVPRGNLHPVSLAHTDASRAMKVILAHAAVSPANVFPHLPDIRLTVHDYFLHYLPFTKTSHELLQPDLGVTINQRVLNYGRSL